MIHLKRYSENSIQGSPGRYLTFQIHDDLQPNFHIPKEILNLLVQVALEMGAVPDDITACFVLIVTEMKRRCPDSSEYPVEVAVVPREA